MDNYRFIITGGPGSGKTTIVETLQSLGYSGFPELARDLISQGITPPGWADKPGSRGFFDHILQQRITWHQQISGQNIGFYDRGIPDSLAYFKFQNRKPPGILLEAISLYRYNPLVFAAPPWKEIFANDSIRRETFDEARILYELATEAYQHAGYSIVELPKPNSLNVWADCQVSLPQILHCYPVFSDSQRLTQHVNQSRGFSSQSTDFVYP